MIDLLNIQPHKVSSDLKGYAICIYGDIGSGKTTEALKAEKPLLVAAEAGYKTQKDAMAIDVNNWTDMLTISAQLKMPQVKEKYSTVIIDTLDELAFYGEQYVLQVNNASKPSDIDFGGFYVQIEQMFRKLFNDITKNYGLIVIAHDNSKTDKDEDTGEKVVFATLAVNKKIRRIISGLVDLMVYIEKDRATPGKSIAHYKSSSRWEAKTRFPNIKNSNIFSYENLVGDIKEAIGDIATAEKHKNYNVEKLEPTQEEFEKVKNEVDSLGKKLVATKGLNTVIELINSILGKKISETDIGDTATLKVLLTEFKEL